MNREQWAVFHALNSGYSAVRLLANYSTARESIVQSGHGRSGVILPAGVWLATPAFWFVIASIVVMFAVDRAAGRSE